MVPGFGGIRRQETAVEDVHRVLFGSVTSSLRSAAILTQQCQMIRKMPLFSISQVHDIKSVMGSKYILVTLKLCRGLS